MPFTYQRIKKILRFRCGTTLQPYTLRGLGLMAVTYHILALLKRRFTRGVNIGGPYLTEG